jgi:hypothetical protein
MRGAARSSAGWACALGGLLLLPWAAAAGCTDDVPSPFHDAGPEPTGAGGAGAGPADAAADADPTLGGPCEQDAQCDDGADCTSDACDLSLMLCRFTPDAAPCQNDVHCDGEERCTPKVGCGPGEPVSCSDDTPCTIDACVEETKTCSHAPRDVDQDGDPDGHCPGGNDCDDENPGVSSLVDEVCDNFQDDDCDATVDESACTTPAHDTCLDPLEITQPGSYAMNTNAAALDYATSCTLANQATARDVVAALLLDPGAPVDVEVTARSDFFDVAVTLVGQCGDAASEIACGGTYPAPQGGKLAKLRGRGVGSATDALALPIYVHTDHGTAVTIDVQLLPPEPLPTHETCGTAELIVPGVPENAYLVDAVKDLGSVCTGGTGDLVYAFTLDAPANVDVYGTSIDGDGIPTLSLRGPGCALPADEITCQSAASAHLFWQSLPAGTYYVAVSASAPTEVSVAVEVSPPTAPQPDETCATAPALIANQTLAVDLAGHQDDHHLGCLPGAADAAYALTLTETSDVLLVQRIASGDTGAVELALPACAGAADQLACGLGALSPVRASEHGVAAGEYRVVAESVLATGIELTAFVRPSVPPTLVPFADSCADVLEIPAGGGLFQGTTANATADFNAGCDQGSVPQGGARDQILELTLAVPKRVVLDMSGSAFTTLLDVRKGPACPGQEVALGCAVGLGPDRSFLDLTLGAGTYYIQVDGYALEEGPWVLDVRVVDP